MENSPNHRSHEVQRISTLGDKIWPPCAEQGEQPTGVTLENKGKIPGTQRKRKIPQGTVAEGTGPGAKVLHNERELQPVRGRQQTIRDPGG